jgi:outer membrane protein assembly factor BamB
MPTPTLLRRTGVVVGLISLWFAGTSTASAQTDGSKRWPNGFTTVSSAIPGNILSSPSLAADGTVYIGTEIGTSSTPNVANGYLYALNPSGTQKWRVTLKDWIDSTPAVALDGTIYVGCWDGSLYAFNADGSSKWGKNSDGSPAGLALGAFVSASPAIAADGTIYIGTGDGSFYAVTDNGSSASVKWMFPTLYWIEAAPAIGPDGTIYIGSQDDTFYAIRPDGTEKWHYTTGNDVVSSAAIGADGTVYVGSRDQSVYAFTPTGGLKWTFATPDVIDASPVLGPDGTIYVPTTGGRLYALRQDGTLKWQFPAASQAALSPLYSTPAVRADGTIVFGTDNSAVYALRPDGTLLWKTAVGETVDTSPVIGPDGMIYVGCTDKNVYSFYGTSALSMTDWPQFSRNDQRTGLQPMGAVAGTTGRLMNMSVRTFAGSGANVLTVGYYIAGSGTRDLLVRGVGPTLANYSVTNALADPNITCLSGQTPFATNDNWQDNANWPTIEAITPTLGAFPLPRGSLDSALLQTFSAGQSNQTIQVSGANGSTGIALLEAYDAGGSSSGYLSNISARSFVDVGAGVLTAGFSISGSTKTVLIRGVGPTLSKWIGGIVANPQLRVYDSRLLVIAENDDWGSATNAAAIDATAPTVGGFHLDPGSADSAMLLTLPPGTYTAQVSGVNNTTGIGLVEVYAVP